MNATIPCELNLALNTARIMGCSYRIVIGLSLADLTQQREIGDHCAHIYADSSLHIVTSWIGLLHLTGRLCSTLNGAQDYGGTRGGGLLYQ